MAQSIYRICLRDVIGSHAGLRSQCEVTVACRFESDRRYMKTSAKKTIKHFKTSVSQITKFDWKRFILPFTTYYKRKYGRIYFLLIFLDLFILVIPFGAIIVVLLVKFVLNDVK